MKEVCFEELKDLATFTQSKSLQPSRASQLKVVNPVKTSILYVKWNVVFYATF